MNEPAPLPAECELLTLDEVRRILRISKSLAYRLCDDGTLPCARIAALGSRRGRYVVRRSDLQAYLDRLFAAAQPREVPLEVDAILATVRHRGGHDSRPGSAADSAGWVRQPTPPCDPR